MSRIIIVLCLLLLAGCEAVSERVRERLASIPPQTQVFEADMRAVSSGVQQALLRLDFTITRARPGQVEASSRIRHSEAFADSRQLVAQVSWHEVAAGRTEVALQLTEEVENATLGGPSVQTLREHGFYATYFSFLQQAIADGSAPAEGKKN